MSAPDPEGRGAEVAMRMALDDAGLAPGEIAYLNLHGTGTPQNDVMEAAAVARVLGESVPCSSTKPLVGHTLGAAGALEAAFCWLVLAERIAAAASPCPRTCGTARATRRSPPIHLAGKGETVLRRAAPARDDELVRLRREQLHADPRRGRAGVKASLLALVGLGAGDRDARRLGRRGRARPRRCHRSVYPTRSSSRRCCGAAARRSPAPC